MLIFILIISIYSWNCPGHLDPTTNCTTCKNHWITIKKECDTCENNFDVKSDCKFCIKGCSGSKCDICHSEPDPNTNLQKHEFVILVLLVVFLILCACIPIVFIFGCMIFCFVMFKCLKISSRGDIKDLLKQELKVVQNGEDKKGYGKIEEDEEEEEEGEEYEKEELILKNGSIN